MYLQSSARTSVLTCVSSINEQQGRGSGDTLLCPLQAGDWANGSKLLKHLTDLGVDPVAYPAIAKALCKLAREHVAPTYKGLYPDGQRGHCILARKVRTRTHTFTQTLPT